MYFLWAFNQFFVFIIAAILKQCLWMASESNHRSRWNWTFLLTVQLMLMIVITLCTSLGQIFLRRVAESFPNLWSGYSKGYRSGLALLQVSSACWFLWSLTEVCSPSQLCILQDLGHAEVRCCLSPGAHSGVPAPLQAHHVAGAPTLCAFAGDQKLVRIFRLLGISLRRE